MHDHWIWFQAYKNNFFLLSQQALSALPLFFFFFPLSFMRVSLGFHQACALLVDRAGLALSEIYVSDMYLERAYWKPPLQRTADFLIWNRRKQNYKLRLLCAVVRNFFFFFLVVAPAICLFFCQIMQLRVQFPAAICLLTNTIWFPSAASTGQIV